MNQKPPAARPDGRPADDGRDGSGSVSSPPRPALRPGGPAHAVTRGPESGPGGGCAAHDPIAQALQHRIEAAVTAAGGWLPFDRFMAMALVEPGLGYYARGGATFGLDPSDGSDFATAPEMSPLFGRALARQVAEAFACGAPEAITEFGGGSGALAQTLLQALDSGGRAPVYRIVEVSAALRERQQERLRRFGARVQWLDALPESLDGVVLGNEVLDALPVALLHWDGRDWWERGVACARPAPPGAPGAPEAAGPVGPSPWRFEDRPTPLRPPVPGPFVPGTTVEIHPQAQAFAATVAQRLQRGLAVFIDYGFPEREYYHPQRTGGTLMCHRLHRSDADPLADVGLKDITAHVDFTGIAVAAQAAGCEVLGYTSQGRFLLNLGLARDLAEAGVRERVAALRLVAEHEMGELFKVLAFGRGLDFGPCGPAGFTEGDRCHRL